MVFIILTVTFITDIGYKFERAKETHRTESRRGPNPASFTVVSFLWSHGQCRLLATALGSAHRALPKGELTSAVLSGFSLGLYYLS